MSDKISIIIPVYKVELFLNQCVESVVNQTYTNLEIVLVDDGSPDNCPSICEDWAKRDSRIKVIHKENGGLMAAWMDGVKVSTGKYICFVDSDDYIKLDYVEKLYKGITKDDADICCSNYFEFDEKNEKPILDIKESITLENDNNGNLLRTLTNHEKVVTCHARWNKMFKREIVEHCLQFMNTDITMGEDLNLTFPAFIKSNRVAYIPDVLYGYRQVGTSMSNQEKDNWKSFEKVVNQLLQINSELNLDFSNYIYRTYYVNFLIQCLRLYIRKKQKEKFKTLLNCEVTKRFIEEYTTKNIKEKLFKWLVKKQSWLLFKIFINLV